MTKTWEIDGRWTAVPAHNPLADEAFRVALPNGYGVSLIRGGPAYSGHDTWEVGVLCNGALCYDTPVTDDVLGYQTDRDVVRILEQLEGLAPVSLAAAVETTERFRARVLELEDEASRLSRTVAAQRDLLLRVLGPETRRHRRLETASAWKKAGWFLYAAGPYMAAALVVAVAALLAYGLDVWEWLIVLMAGVVAGEGVGQGVAMLLRGGPRDD